VTWNTLSDEEWFGAHVASYARSVGEDLPGLPPDDIQRNTTGQAGVATLREAFSFYKDCLEAFERSGARLSEGSRLLDFGVGWGRTARFFLRELSKQDVFGIDVDPDLIAICRETFQSDNFFTCDPFPPTQFPEAHFDVVVGFSVFSHLSEDACQRWMAEFHRIVRPGGLLALTTRGRFFFDYCQSLASSPDSYARSLAQMFDDFDTAKSQYDTGHFVHTAKGGVAGAGARSGAYYGETFIPEQYAAKAWSHLFSLLEFLDDTPGKHPVMFFKRLA
jgi:SAM-dependent methyltransferase